MSSITVGIIYKHSFKPARLEAEKVEKWLQERDVITFSEEMCPGSKQDRRLEKSTSMPEDLSWIIVLGGDGTLLGAARKVGRYGVPMLGVNLGGLGFLTGIPLKRLYPAIEMILQDQLEVECRLMLETMVIRANEEVCSFQSLNDVVIHKGSLARIFDLDVYINKEFLTTFRADGLIISTPTGSTGYNLSAGGPILYPTMSNVILTPICPFTLTNRPIILPDTDNVAIKMHKEDEEERVRLTIDGQVGFDLVHGDEIRINKSDIKIHLFKSPDQTYFEILRTKLMWGGATYKQDDDK